MKNKKIWLGMLVITLVFGMTVIGCGGGSLVGRWSLESGQPTYGNIEKMELLKDRTGIVDGAGVTWKVENGRFYIMNPLSAASWGFKISGATLTLITDNGTNLTYKREIKAAYQEKQVLAGICVIIIGLIIILMVQRIVQYHTSSVNVFGIPTIILKRIFLILQALIYIIGMSLLCFFIDSYKFVIFFILLMLIVIAGTYMRLKEEN